MQPNNAGAAEETSLPSLLEKLCRNDEFADLTLEGTDGKSIRANRCILAGRSVVFQKMLFGKYCEAQSSVVQLGYEGKILKAVKEYCYTDHAIIFDESPCDESWARSMMQLAAASDYLGLPMMRKKVLDVTHSKMKDEPALSCVIFEAAEESPGDVGHDFSEVALDVIQSRTEAALLPPESSLSKGAVSLRQETLTKILQNSKLMADEIVLFRALKAWSDADDSLCKEHVANLCCRKRKDIAVDQMMHINLKRIKPSDLRSLVEPSGLATPDQVIEAFKAHAFRLEEGATSIQTMRLRLLHWDISNDAIFECKKDSHRTALLKCDPLVSGVHTWSLEMKEAGNCGTDEVGVACAAQWKNWDRSDWLSGTAAGWMYEGEGSTRHKGTRINYEIPSFKKGSIITFTLDLSAGGTMTASVDGKNPFQLFDKIVDRLEGSSVPSFVPAVSLGLKSSVQFLGFQ